LHQKTMTLDKVDHLGAPHARRDGGSRAATTR
jgi:hypothetical protein